MTHPINDAIEHITHAPAAVSNFVTTHLKNISSHTLGWISIVFLHLASVPTLLAVLMNQSDHLPPFDIMVFVWCALITLFFKSLIERNFLYITTICVGFVGQTLMMGLILFK
jgi:hypothetical protein